MEDSMDDRYVIPCLADGVLFDSILEIEENGLCRIFFKMGDESITTEADNYFYALIKLRKKLEAEDKKLLCLGCARDVYPSPMMLDMGDGSRAYHLTLGKKAKMDEIVSIFEPCEQDAYSTIEEQEAFYNAWASGPKE